MIVYSVHGWRHFLVCNTHIAVRLLRRGKKHEIACTSWLFCLWKLCELMSNIEEQLCIVFMYTGNLYHLHDLATQALVSFKKYMPPPLPLPVEQGHICFEWNKCLLFLFLKRREHIFFEWNKCLCLAIWKWLKKCVHLKCICFPIFCKCGDVVEIEMQ